MSGMVALVNLLMTLSPSTAECERQFPSMNSIKTTLRNSLVRENLCDLMLIAYDGSLPKQFLPGLDLYVVMVVVTSTATRRK